jgi:WD40 repeat protein
MLPTILLESAGKYAIHAIKWQQTRMQVRSHNLARMRLVLPLEQHGGPVHSAAFHPTAPILATGSRDNTLKLWLLSSDLLSVTCVATLAGHSSSVESVAFHPNAPILATGSSDQTVKLWRLSSDNSSATCVATLEGHTNCVYSVAFHPTAPILATGSSDQTVKLWLLSPDQSSAICVATLQTICRGKGIYGTRSGIVDVAFHSTAPILACATDAAILWH